MIKNSLSPNWHDLIPEGDFISNGPTYSVGKYFDLFKKDVYAGNDRSMSFYYFDPTENGYSQEGNYPILIFLHGSSNSLEGDVCINYSGAEMYASPEYQREFQGAYILVPLANEYINDDNNVEGGWSADYKECLFSLIDSFISAYCHGVTHKFLFGNSSGARMAFIMGNNYSEYFDAIIPCGGNEIPDDDTLDIYEKNNLALFFAMGQKDETCDFEATVRPRLNRLSSMKDCFIYTPLWIRNADKGIASIDIGREIGQHCVINAIGANLMFDDGTPMDERLPRGVCGWIDEINRGGHNRARLYPAHGKMMKTGRIEVEDNIFLYYEEFGEGDNVILSAQVGFYHRGMQQYMANLGYHVFCISLRGFHPSSLVDEDYGEKWYDVFANDVLTFSDKMNIEHFTYMGASHGSGVGWHLMLMHSPKVVAFVAVVGGPHSLADGTMSYRQMLEQGIIKEVPPFDPLIDSDGNRELRREYRNKWISESPRGYAKEQKLDYKRPLMRLKTEEKLMEALRTIDVPTLMIGGINDPISTPELMMRTAGCIPHGKLIIYSNCGHNIDTDLIEETCDEADRFIRNVYKTGRWYLSVKDDFEEIGF